MDYQSSRPFRPACAGAELRHRHVRRRQRLLQGLGIDRRGRRVSADRRLSRSRREHVRHRRRLFRRARRTDPGRGDQGQAQPPADFHQGDLPDRRRARTTMAPRASIFSRRSRVRSSGSASRRSTSCNCTARTTTRRSRRRCPRSTSSFARARSATSAARISPAGI